MKRVVIFFLLFGLTLSADELINPFDCGVSISGGPIAATLPLNQYAQELQGSVINGAGHFTKPRSIHHVRGWKFSTGASTCQNGFIWGLGLQVYRMTRKESAYGIFVLTLDWDRDHPTYSEFPSQIIADRRFEEFSIEAHGVYLFQHEKLRGLGVIFSLVGTRITDECESLFNSETDRLFEKHNRRQFVGSGPMLGLFAGSALYGPLFLQGATKIGFFLGHRKQVNSFHDIEEDELTASNDLGIALVPVLEGNVGLGVSVFFGSAQAQASVGLETAIYQGLFQSTQLRRGKGYNHRLDHLVSLSPYLSLSLSY